jgi:hypothetical protein
MGIGLVLLSPIYFVQRWTNGLPFDQAVQAAAQDEIAALRTYETQLGLQSALVDADTIEQSQQFVGGRKRDLPWSDYSAYLPPQ